VVAEANPNCEGGAIVAPLNVGSWNYKGKITYFFSKMTIMQNFPLA
jgi:hypothetical protein